MIKTLPIQSIVDRLESATSIFREIGGAAGYARAVRETRRPPAAFAIPLRDVAGPNRYGTCVGQRVAAGFGVVILARDIRHDGGLETATELERCRGDVHGALLGWSPGEGFEGVTYTGGLIVTEIGRDGLLGWQASYESAFQLEEMR